MKLSDATAWDAIKAPIAPTPEPNANPHLRPQARIKKAAGKVPKEVPISIIVIGTVANVRSSPNMAIETRDAVKNVKVRPLKNNAWQLASTKMFLKLWVLLIVLIIVKVYEVQCYYSSTRKI